MNRFITYTAITLSFAMMLIGCLTEKKAHKQIGNIAVKHEGVLMDECGKRYPPKDSIWEKETFIPGETMVVIDTVAIDCDSVRLAAESLHSNGNDKKSLQVKIPVKSQLRVDTFYKTKFQQVENTAMIEANRKTINQLENDNIRMSHSGKVKTIIILILAAILALILIGKRMLPKLFTFPTP